MNNWFNFSIPYFNSQFGEDWEDFNDIVEENVDYVMNKTYELYWLQDVSRMPLLAIEKALRVRGIETWPTEDIQSKRLKIRTFATNFNRKATGELYLDYAEAIVGIRGEIYGAYEFGESVWDMMIWPIPGTPDDADRVWETPAIIFEIYIDVKTTDSDLLDAIVDEYRQKFLLPAFYQIYLVDEDMTILRTV
jgi:hypothetical protein